MKKIVKIAIALIAAMCIGICAAHAEDAAGTTLKQGDRGDAVRRLQSRLADLGFFSGVADGDYGPQTTNAVMEFQTYLSLSERLEIYGPEAMIPVIEVEGEEEAASDVLYEVDLSLVPTTISVDGIASPALQAALFDDDLDLFIGEVVQGQKDEAALRVQRRLAALNYLDDKMDGEFGLNSVAALKKFQRFNGLEETGVADGPTREILYSPHAVVSDKPVYNQLFQGSEGDVVRALQERMLLMGFSTSKPDGRFGDRSTQSVRALQEYLWHLENPMEAVGGYIDPDIAYSPEKRGFVANGVASPEMIEYMLEGNFQIFREELGKGSVNKQEIERVQRRLYALLYIAGSTAVDGDYGDNTEDAVREFQERSDLPVTGIADQTTQLKLFSADATRALKPYLIRVSINNQKVYIYKPDANEEFTILHKTFTCSTGTNETPTPLGTFTHTSPGTDEWHFFSEFNSWAHYPYYIVDDIMFHSVLFNEKDNDRSLQTGTLRNLGKKASHGCIRLRVEDAKWIWDNCPRRTTIIIEL